MRIAIDAMGSEGAPDVEAAGAAAASLDADDTEILLVGDSEKLNPLLERFSKKGAVQVIHASEVITMDDPPVQAVRRKKDASLLVAMRLVKEGEADCVISAGNTGAVMVAARTILGPIRGVARSALCQCLPAKTGRVVMLDLGANVDCTTRQLCEFAEMGIAYSHYALGVAEPRVGLLNIGEEMGKGSQVARETHQRLHASPLVNFIGNIEPAALFRGEADVAVCDGFIGNMFLKTTESTAKLMGQMLREYFESSSMSKIGAMLARKALREMKKQIDPNEYPGAPLLGVNGLVFILHGSCADRAVENAVAGARTAFENDLIGHIREMIAAWRCEQEKSGTSLSGNGHSRKPAAPAAPAAPAVNEPGTKESDAG
jgi:phosphate acyltransferase